MTSESWRETPHVTYFYEADVDKFFDKFREIYCDDKKVSFNTLVLKIITEGLKAAPHMNAHITFSKHTIRGHIDVYEDINISMPMILPSGEMMTINLKNLEDKSLADIQADVEEVKRKLKSTNLTQAMYSVGYSDTMKKLKKGHVFKAIGRLWGAKIGEHKIKTLKGRDKREYEGIPVSDRLISDDLEQGTVTVSNIGSTYLEQKGAMMLLEIIPPQVCAFAIGNVQKKPVVIEEDGSDSIVIRKVLPICIAFDHRALDFSDIVPFMKRLDEIFAEPEILNNW